MSSVENAAHRARNAVLDVAEGLFARYGFKKTSIEDIARAARIGKGSVYLHFSSKEDLFGEVVRRVSDRMMSTLVEAVRRARTPAAKLRAFIRAHLNDVAAIAAEYHLDEERLMELLPLAEALRQAHRAQEVALLEGVLRDGRASGSFAINHTGRLATGLLASVQALETSALRFRDQPEFRAALGEVLDVILRGLENAALEHADR